eukprot:11912721-Karenia_brevis.AAC.1
MANGRYYLKKLGLEKAAGWRRGRSLGVFKDRSGEIQTGLICDDPGLPDMDVEDAKAFLRAGASELATSI